MFFAKALLYNIVTGKEASRRLVTESFMDLLEPRDRNILHKAQTEVMYSSELILEITGLFSNFSITQLPIKSTIEVVLNSLAHHTICLKPFYYIHHKNNAITDLFGSVDESDLLKYLDEMAPDGKKMVLSPEYSLDGHLSTHGMRVFEYLQRYVSALNVESSNVFLKCVTGMEVLRNELSIKVLFNGELNWKTWFHEAILVHRRCIYRDIS